MRKNRFALCFLILVSVLFSGCVSQKDIDRAYQDGYAKAEEVVYKQAYDEGFSAGSDEAKTYIEYEIKSAYDDGYKDGAYNTPNNSDKWYEWGRQYGFEEGWDAAFVSINENNNSYYYVSEETKNAYRQSGYDDGYSDGYDDGLREGYDQGYYDYEQELTEHAEEYDSYFDDRLSEAYEEGYYDGYYDGEDNND